MQVFRRHGEVIDAKLTSNQIEVLLSLVRQLEELLGEGVPEQPRTDDPFELWAADLQADPDAPEVSDDPVLQRLFPNPYPHDAEASSDFRRFTERDQRQRKIDDLRLVADDLVATESGQHRVEVPPDHAASWLKAFTAVRLSLATRLGIDDEDSMAELEALPDEDPRFLMYSVFNWLGYLQESLVELL